jgi:hypothetical protein
MSPRFFKDFLYSFPVPKNLFLSCYFNKFNPDPEDYEKMA